MRTIKVFVVSVSILFASSIYAGAYNPEPLLIEIPEDGQPGLVEGAMGAVRFSANDVDRIGCRVLGIAGGITNVACLAEDEFGTLAGCVSNDQNILNAAQAISAYSWIRFEWVQNDGLLQTRQACTRLYVSTRSFHIPDADNQKGK